METVILTSNYVAHLSKYLPVRDHARNAKALRADFLDDFVIGESHHSMCFAHRRTARKAVVYSTKVACCNHSTLCGITSHPRRAQDSGSSSSNGRHRGHEEFLLAGNPARGWQMPPPSRGYGMLVVRILRGALKLRYIVLGGAIGGGVSLSKVSFASYITCIELRRHDLFSAEIRGMEGWTAGF